MAQGIEKFCSCTNVIRSTQKSTKIALAKVSSQFSNSCKEKRNNNKNSTCKKS